MLVLPQTDLWGPPYGRVCAALRWRVPSQQHQPTPIAQAAAAGEAIEPQTPMPALLLLCLQANTLNLRDKSTRASKQAKASKRPSKRSIAKSGGHHENTHSSLGHQVKQKEKPASQTVVWITRCVCRSINLVQKHFALIDVL